MAQTNVQAHAEPDLRGVVDARAQLTAQPEAAPSRGDPTEKQAKPAQQSDFKLLSGATVDQGSESGAFYVKARPPQTGF